MQTFGRGGGGAGLGLACRCLRFELSGSFVSGMELGLRIEAIKPVCKALRP